MMVHKRELSAGAISERFHVTRSAISQHLTILKQAGLVAERRQGTRRIYSSIPQALTGVRCYLDAFRATERLISDERISVERAVQLDARRETIWDFLVDPSLATQWMGQSASFDLRVGGRYQVEVLPGLVAAGEFLEIDRPNQLVHSWGWRLDGGPVPPGSTTVVYELQDEGEATHLRLCHRDLPSLATAGSHSRGWAHYLPRLAAAASGEPSPDPWVSDPAQMQLELQPTSGTSTAFAVQQNGERE